MDYVHGFPGSSFRLQNRGCPRRQDTPKQTGGTGREQCPARAGMPEPACVARRYKKRREPANVNEPRGKRPVRTRKHHGRVFRVHQSNNVEASRPETAEKAPKSRAPSRPENAETNGLWQMSSYNMYARTGMRGANGKKRP